MHSFITLLPFLSRPSAKIEQSLSHHLANPQPTLNQLPRNYPFANQYSFLYKPIYTLAITQPPINYLSHSLASQEQFSGFIIYISTIMYRIGQLNKLTSFCICTLNRFIKHPATEYPFLPLAPSLTVTRKI